MEKYWASIIDVYNISLSNRFFSKLQIQACNSRDYSLVLPKATPRSRKRPKRGPKTKVPITPKTVFKHIRVYQNVLIDPYLPYGLPIKTNKKTRLLGGFSKILQKVTKNDPFSKKFQIEMNLPTRKKH